MKEYLPELQRRTKWQEATKDYERGDLVLIMDENTQRGKWPLALIIDVIKGRDERVRSVRLRTQTTTLVRPITKIVPLELS